jgi:hypothetical protein
MIPTCRTGSKCWVPHFKPYFGLSGITNVDVPLPVQQVQLRA